MKALRWHGARDLRYEDVPEPDAPSVGQALVEVSYCGVCGTDLHEYLAGPHMIRAKSHPLTKWVPPFALGHEMSGTVLALGSPAAGVKVGDRVAVDPCWLCGTCRWCVRGEYHLCPLGGSVGLASPGAFADQVIVPTAGLVPLPDDVPDDMAALAEPMAVALHAVSRADLRPGENVLILGAGPIGMAILLCARLAGAAGIFVSEPVAARRERATALGATEAMDPAQHDVRREVFLRTGRVGPDVVIEATGVASLTPLAITTVRRGGRVVLAGVTDGGTTIDPTQLLFYERSLHGSLGYNFDIPRVVSLMQAGRLDVSALITGRYPLSAGLDVFRELEADKDSHLKVLLTPKEN